MNICLLFLDFLVRDSSESKYENKYLICIFLYINYGKFTQYIFYFIPSCKFLLYSVLYTLITQLILCTYM